MDVLADETRQLDDLKSTINQKGREVFERIFIGEVMTRLYRDLKQVEDIAHRIQRNLSKRRFGSNRYAFELSPVDQYERFVEFVRKGYLLDMGDEKSGLRECLEAHREEILDADVDQLPDIFDYRRWFRFRLKVLTENEEGRVIDRQRMRQRRRRFSSTRRSTELTQQGATSCWHLRTTLTCSSSSRLRTRTA